MRRIVPDRPWALVVLLWSVPLAFFAVTRHYFLRGMRDRMLGDARQTATRPPVGVDGQVRSRSLPAGISAIANLPYILHAPDSRTDLVGVIENHKGRTSPGLNFFFPWSWETPEAFLMDMDGKIVWRWTLSGYKHGNEHLWLEHAELLPDGSVLWVLKDRSILKVDRDSKIVWEASIRAHHDVWPTENGDYWVLSHERVPDTGIYAARPIESDQIVLLSGDGKIRKKIPIIELLRRSGLDYLLPRLQSTDIDPKIDALDVFHTNHVEPLDGRLESRSPIYRKGNLLVSIRNINLIAIVDPHAGKIVWLWGPGNLSYQHDPRMLSSGEILVFDNGASQSQLVQLDPLTDRVTWRYAPSGFFSSVSGAVQRLSNGNTLATESMRGYAFEVTPAGEVVWKYANPQIRKNGERNGIIRMTRVDPASLNFLGAPAPITRADADARNGH